MTTIELNYRGITRTAVVIRPHGASTLCYQVSPKLGFRSFTTSDIRSVTVIPTSEAINNLLPEKVRALQTN